MEPRIIKGHIYKCKQDVHNDYCKGHIYECEYEQGYPEEGANWAKYACGFISNNSGNTGHAWPYDPEHHPSCSDRWTDFFEDLGEKPANVILTPYSIGDSVRWYCDDDGRVRRTKIIGINIEIDEHGKMEYFYTTRIKFKGIMQNATIHVSDIARAER